MSTWTDQPGFPVVILRSVTSKSFTVDQERFLISNLINVTENVDVEAFPFSYRPVNTKKQLWSIPLTFGVYSNATGTVKSIAKGWADFTDSQSMEIKFEKAIPEGALVLFNHQQTGVYRSLYDIDTYYTLLNWLKADKDVFPAVERAGLFSDIFSMSFSGRLTDPIVSLELIKLLHSETNVLVWETALKDLETLKDIFALTPAYGAMLEFQARLQDSVLKSVGWIETSPYKADHHIRGKLRGRLLAEAIRNGHKQTTATALRYFALLRKGQDSKVHVSPDAYGAIYNAGIIHGDLNDYKWVQSKYLNSNFAAEQQMYLHALASSPAPHLQAQTLAFAISGKVRQQDITSLVSNVATLTPVGHISVWLFFMENWDDLTTGTNAKTFGINFLMLGKFNKLLQTVTGAFTKQYLIKEAENLFIKRIDPDFFVPQLAEVSVMKGLETAKQLLAWRKLNGQKVSEWLDKNTGGNKITSF